MESHLFNSVDSQSSDQATNEAIEATDQQLESTQVSEVSEVPEVGVEQVEPQEVQELEQREPEEVQELEQREKEVEIETVEEGETSPKHAIDPPSNLTEDGEASPQSPKRKRNENPTAFSSSHQSPNLTLTSESIFPSVGDKSFHPTHTVNFDPVVPVDKLPPKSRLFIGNLAVEKTNKHELASIFVKYGNIWEISLKSSFGFIQFDNPESCQAAMMGEAGTVVGGLRMDLKLSKDKKDKKDKPKPKPYDRKEPRNPKDTRSRDKRRSSTPPPDECHIIVLGDVENRFINYVEDRVELSGLYFRTLFLNPRENIKQIVGDLQTREKSCGIIFVESKRQKSGNVACQVFSNYGRVAEYDNIHVDKAIDLIIMERDGRSSQNIPQFPIQQPLQPNPLQMLANLDPATLLSLVNAAQQRPPNYPAPSIPHASNFNIPNIQQQPVIPIQNAFQPPSFPNPRFQQPPATGYPPVQSQNIAEMLSKLQGMQRKQ